MWNHIPIWTQRIKVGGVDHQLLLLIFLLVIKYAVEVVMICFFFFFLYYNDAIKTSEPYPMFLMMSRDPVLLETI